MPDIKTADKPYYCATLSMTKDIPHNALALDIGCGQNPCFFCNHINNYIGIDIDINTLKKVLQETHDASLIRASGSNAPFKDSVFRLIICTEVLEHLENPGKMIKEISRVLVKRGIVVISIPSLSLPQTIVLWIANRTRRISGKPYQSQDHMREYARFNVTPHFQSTFGLFELFRQEELEVCDVATTQSLYLKPRIFYVVFLSKIEKVFEKIFSRHLIGHHTIFRAEKK